MKKMNSKGQPELKFLYRNECFTLKQLEANEHFSKLKAPILFHGNSAFLKFVHVFENSTELKNWAADTKMEGQVNTILEKMAEAKKLKGEDHEWAKKKLTEKANRIAEDLKELSKRSGLPIGSEKLFRLATMDAPLIEGAVFDPALLFMDINFTGHFFAMWNGLIVPDFTWFGVNDRISAVHVWGLLVLCEHSWLGGRNLWLGGADWRVADLSKYGFNDRASSGILF
jgi:hypothetical protein